MRELPGKNPRSDLSGKFCYNQFFNSTIYIYRRNQNC